MNIGIKSISNRTDRLETIITQNNIMIHDLNATVEKLSKENQVLREKIDLLKKDRMDKG